MSADEILQQCIATLSQRGKQYDIAHRERSAGQAAYILSETFGLTVSPKFVWQTLLAVKLARLRTATAPDVVADTLIDIINYFALLGEELTQQDNDA